MAEAQRSAFSANLQQLEKAFTADDQEAGKSAVFGLANLLFFEIDRVADALDRIATQMEKPPKFAAIPLGEQRFR